MAEYIREARKSPRNGIDYDSVPTRKGWMLYCPETYASILDCVFEMADHIMTGNGVPASTAVQQVLRDERWTLLPSHFRVIVARLEK